MFKERMKALLAQDGPGEPPEHGTSVGTLLDIVSNSRRRLVIQVLADKGTVEDIGTFSEAVAAAEFGTPVTSDERKRVYVSLYQTHLPKLERVGVIDWEGESRHIISPGENHEAAMWLVAQASRLEE